MCRVEPGLRLIYVGFFFLMIRRPPRSTPLSLHDALPISAHWPAAARLARVRGGHDTEGAGARQKRARAGPFSIMAAPRSEEHTSELQSRLHLVCRLLLEKKKKIREHPRAASCLTLVSSVS